MHLVPNERPSAAILPFAAPRPQSASTTTWPMHTVAFQLGVDRRSEAWQRDYLTALIANEGFPPPLPTMVKGQIQRDIAPRKSRWIAAAVQAWLDGTLPPGFTAAMTSAEAREAADRLDQAAENLFAGDAA